MAEFWKLLFVPLEQKLWTVVLSAEGGNISNKSCCRNYLYAV